MAVYRIGGMIISNCKKVCRFCFGDFYVSAKLNAIDRVFEITLKKELPVRQENGEIIMEQITDYVDIEKFKNFWGAQWRITFIKTEKA